MWGKLHPNHGRYGKLGRDIQHLQVKCEVDTVGNTGHRHYHRATSTQGETIAFG